MRHIPIHALIITATALLLSGCPGGEVTVPTRDMASAPDIPDLREDTTPNVAPDLPTQDMTPDPEDMPDAPDTPADTPPDTQPDMPVDLTPTSVTVTLHADQGASRGTTSFAVPLPPGLLSDASNMRLLDGSNEVPAQYDVLATWPHDDSLRSVLVQLSIDLADGAERELTVEINAPRDVASDLNGLSPNPDGPVVGVLPASWYVGARVVTAPMQAAADSPYEAYEAELVRNLFGMDPAYDSYDVSCGSTNRHRSYYDGPRAIYVLFLRTGTPRLYRRARAEARWYRDNELLWSRDRQYAYHTCQGNGWTPDEPLSWSVLRRMTGQGMLDDYLLSGDADAREATVSMGNAFVANLPALRNPTRNDPQGSIQATERNLAWTMMGVASSFAITRAQDQRDALVSLMDEIIEWQNRGTSGSLEHDIMRPDPTECSNGPAGASPFMTTLIVDAVMDHYYLLRDARSLAVVTKIADWMHRDALQSNGESWRYLWNCASNDYDNGPYNDLNLMMIHVYGAAYIATGDRTWIDRGDALAGFGLADMFTRRPKQWNQSTRTFGKYLGYRVADPEAERAGARDLPGPTPR